MSFKKYDPSKKYSDNTAPGVIPHGKQVKVGSSKDVGTVKHSNQNKTFVDFGLGSWSDWYNNDTIKVKG